MKGVGRVSRSLIILTRAILVCLGAVVFSAGGVAAIAVMPPQTMKDPLQQRFTAIMTISPNPDGGASRQGEMNAMARELAAAGETHALVRLWDKMGGAAAADGETWEALQVWNF